MSACKHRPEDGCVFIPCFDAIRDETGKRLGCLCAAEVKAELPENREARVPDSAREGAA